MPTRSIPWPRILAEGLAIVVSILLAFGIQAWWEERQERAEEHSLLKGLLDDFRANQAPLDERISQHERLAGGADELVRILTTSSAPEVEVADSLLLSLSVTPTYEARLGTLEEAQSSGRIGLVRGSQLRSMLAAWPGRLEDALEEQRTAYDLWVGQFFDVIGQSVSMADLGPANRRFLSGRPQEDPNSSRVIPVTPGLANYSFSRRRALSRSAEELTFVRAQLDSIVALLQSEIAR